MSALTFGMALDLILSANEYGTSSPTLNGHLSALKERLILDLKLPSDFFKIFDEQPQLEETDELATLKYRELTPEACSFYKEVALDIGYM